MAESLPDELIDAVYRVVLDPGAWQDVMGLMRRTFPSAAQTFYFLHLHPRRVQPVSLAGVEPAWLKTFDELYFAPDNPWIRLTERLHRPGVVRTNERLDDLLKERGALYRSAYYHDWMRPHGFKYTIGNTLLAEGGLVANITLFRAPDARTFGEPEVRAFAALSKHMTRALQMAIRLDQPESSPSVAALLDTMPQPVAVIDGQRRVSYANPAMERLLRGRRGLSLRGGELVATAAGAQAALAAYAAPTGPASAAQGSPPLTLPDGRRGHLTLRGVPLAGRMGASSTSRRGLLLMVTGHAPAEPAATAALRAVHACTASETRLARLLAEGRTLRQTAQEMGITYETARAYLKTVFHKTGVHTQAQLVTLLLTGTHAGVDEEG
ncbi:MAG TPA: helix-turn-helix transcriptional regulator [Caldimonas sp.]|jgi:DNA-binding CsgD family transcriptional regulator/PAS domain-containing protein|nr:helix-turn-helix transcriptional regulator [Caldimonas sp.]HEX2539655.1 helix-turn-helix transcriptional regulator [Caldimonas sp.]